MVESTIDLMAGKVACLIRPSEAILMCFVESTLFVVLFVYLICDADRVVSGAEQLDGHQPVNELRAKKRINNKLASTTRTQN